MINFSSIKTIQEDIAKYNSSADLMIVTKKQSVADIEKLIINHFIVLGENRVQEAKTKYLHLRNKYDFNLHLIGHLQTNKVFEALKLFNCIQSIDRKKLVDEIVKHINKSEVITQKFFIEVNLGDEAQKSGIRIPELKDFYEYCILKNMPIEGLMCIPPVQDKPSNSFKKMLLIRDNLSPKLKLSMGMSSDYIDALKNQSNLIRVGSMIFS